MLPARLRTFFYLPASLHWRYWPRPSTRKRPGLVPCPLCFSQRLLLGVYALLCLAAVLQAPGTAGIRCYARATLGCSLTGALLAARHVWLQGADGAIPVCPVPIGRLLEQSGARRLGNCCSVARIATR